MARPINIKNLAKAIAETQNGVAISVAAKRYKIHRDTITKNIKNLDPTSNLALLIQRQLRMQEQSWAQDIEPAIKEGIRYLVRAYEDLDTKDPQAVSIVTASIAQLSELAMTRKILQQRMTPDAEIATSQDALAEARGELR